MEKLFKDDYIHGGTQKNFYEEDERETCDCPLCGENDFHKLDEERGLSVVKRNHCNLIYTNPRAIDAHSNYFGEKDIYYSEARLVFKGKKPHHRDRNYRYELDKIKKVKKEGKLLDVGTNMGFFLRKARENGFETEGIEPSISLCEIARKNWGLEVHNYF